MNHAAVTDLPTVTGRVKENRGELLILDIPGTDYRLHLAPAGPHTPNEGEKVTGRIYAHAKRVDPIRSGGRFIEPGYGRPRRVQGTITGGDLEENRLYVNCGGAPVIATLMPAQQAGDFGIGQMVLFDVERGARFELEE